jgi:hypothetical protein
VQEVVLCVLDLGVTLLTFDFLIFLTLDESGLVLTLAELLA